MQMVAFRGQSAFTVNGISPSSGAASGGTSLKITGTGFLSGATVTFGGVAGTNVTVVNSSTITATTPSHTAATVNVVVANSNGQSGTLTNGFTYTGSTGGAVKFVQVNYMTSTSASSLTTAYSSQQTAGNLNLVAVMWGDTTRAVSSVTDSKGNSYALAVGPTKATGLTSAIYYAKNIAGGSNTVTVTFNGTAAYPNVNVLEYSGLDTGNPLDVGAAATGSGTTANSGSATTTSANELIVGAGNPTSGFTGAGSGFSSRTINGFGGISEDRVVSSPGSYNATAALTSGTWVMQMAAFRASGQASGSNPAPTVTGITPSSGPAGGGTGVTITGTGFLAGATVKLGGTAASNVVVVGSTSITATSAAHAAGAVDVVVSNSDAQSGTLPQGYSYTASNPAPTVTGITPSSGPAGGGTGVTITGTGFLAGATVKLGGTAASNVVVASSTSITVTSAAHAAGAVDVVVTNSDGQSATRAGGYTYNAASVGSISFVQVKSTTQTSGTTVAIAYPAAQTAGNLNVVAVMWGDTTSTVSSVTDSKGNSYALAVGPTKATGLTSAIYYAKNIAGGSNTVTVKFNQSAGYPNVNVLEYSGLDTANPLDVSAAATGSGTTANSGSATTTSANELIVGAGNPSSGFTGAGSGFSSRLINGFGGISEDRVVSSPGSYNATAPLTSGSWVMQMAAFRVGTGTGAQGSSKHSVSIAWDPSPSTDVAYYNVYRGTVSGGPYSLLGTDITATAYTDSTVQSGATYFYVTTAVDVNREESIYSNEFPAVIPSL
jgi:hypothetical protein